MQNLSKKGKTPYREMPRANLPADVTLVSLDGAQIEVNRFTPNGDGWYWAADLSSKGDFRMHGLTWICSAAPKDGCVALINLHQRVSALRVIENCAFVGELNDPSISLFIRSDHGTSAKVLIRDSYFEGRIEPGFGDVDMTVERNWFVNAGAACDVGCNQSGSITVRQNVFQTDWGFRIQPALAKEPSAQSGVDLFVHNNVFDVTESPVSSYYPDNTFNELGQLCRSVKIVNNVMRSRKGHGIILLPLAMEKVKDRWITGPNAYVAEPHGASKAEAWPKQPNDIVLPKHFLSVEPEDADYLRIAADGPLATGGAGADLPSYFGAFPPGLPPKDGDWFTRMLEMKKLRAAHPYASDLLAQARQALDANDFAKAMSLADEAVRMEPDYAEAHYLRGNTLYRQGKHVEAIPEFEKTLELNPMHESAMIELAWTLADTNPSDATIARLSKMLDHVSRGFVAAAIHNRRGNVWTLQGRFDKGMQDYEAGIKADPTAAGNYHGKSAILDRLGDHEAADAAWAETVKLIPAHDRMGWTKRLDDVVPLPVPLAEWREGREFLTVAQKGPADHRTIQDALNALKPGQYVKVLDKGPYRETIIHHRAISDYALVSEVGTRIEVPQWHKWGPSPNDKEKSIYQGCFLSSPNGLRLSGIEFHLPPLPPDADGVAAVEFAGAGDLIIESCQVRYHRDAVSDLPEIEKQHLGRFVGLTFGWFGEWTAVKKGRFLVQDNLIDGKVELRADGPVQVTVQRNWIRTSAPSASMELPFHAETECAIRHNLIQGPFGICLRARGPEKHELTTGRYLITNNLIDADNCPFWALPISIWPENERADRQTLSRAVTLQNNVIRSQKRSGLELSPDDLQAMTGVWKIGHNCFGAEPQHIGPSNFPAFPKQPTDLIVAGPFLSEDPQQADYLRIVADGRLATSGVGGNLPSYMGPLPPGPAPQGGDWFTRLREASAEKE